MKRFISTTALVVGLMPCVAQTEEDSIHHVLGEASVIAMRATQQTPIAFTNLSRDEISRNNHGQDIPYLINSTPSVVSTSDAGAGVGYTSVRIRGVDATRINVTANGIPAASNSAKLTVTTSITAQPANKSGIVGSTARFTVAASGVGLSYQWQYKAPGYSWKNNTIPGCKTDTLPLVAYDYRDGYQYRCIIKDTAGNTVTSAAAALTIGN